MPGPEYISRTVHCSDVDANGCVTPALPNPFNGDLIFSCTGGCNIKVCDPNFVVNGTITVGAGCNVTFTGNLTVNGTTSGIYAVVGTESINP